MNSSVNRITNELMMSNILYGLLHIPYNFEMKLIDEKKRIAKERIGKFTEYSVYKIRQQLDK